MAVKLLVLEAFLFLDAALNSEEGGAASAKSLAKMLVCPSQSNLPDGQDLRKTPLLQGGTAIPGLRLNKQVRREDATSLFGVSC